MSPASNPPVGFRIQQGETITAYVWSADNVILGGHFRILYDDGGIEDWTLDQLTTGTSRARLQMFSNRTAHKGGWVVAGGFTFQGGTKTKVGMTYVQAGIAAEPSADETWRGTICQGYVYFGHTLSVGEFVESERWTSYIFQGTIAEDATAGTHVCTLTVTPATGSEFRLVAGMIVEGNTATAQQPQAIIDDGAGNTLYYLLISAGDTTANRIHVIPAGTAVIAAGTHNGLAFQGSEIIISGAMRLILQVSTAAVSVTQSFSVELLVRGGVKPTSVLLDTIGTSTNTTNTDAFFGTVQPT